MHRHADLLAWVGVLWLLLCLACCIRAYLDPDHHSVYHNYSHAGRAWVAGADAYDIDMGEERSIPRMSAYRYAPLVSVLLVPFSVFPDAIGGVLWRLASYVAFFAAFGWYLRDGLPGGDTYGAKQKALLWLLLIPLSLGSMSNGQANVLLMALVLAAGTAVITERWNLAAGCLAGACLLKLYPVAIALLLLLVHPKKLGWRFVAALAAGLLLPFLMQTPSYVFHQYENWLLLVGSDDRRDFPMHEGYRDFYLLTRFFGAPMAAKAYLALQLLAAGALAALVLLGRLRCWSPRFLVTALLSLGTGWLVVFGPSTESCTFILIAAPLAWALVDCWQPGRPAWSRAALLLVLAMFLAPNVASWFPGGRDWFYVFQPLGALLFLIERSCATIALATPPTKENSIGPYASAA